MTACPKCQSVELRVHGSRSHVSYRRRWGWLGRKRPRVDPVGLDVSCSNCLYAFTVREHGVSEAPLQTAFDSLREVQAGLKVIQGTGRKSSDDEKPQPRATTPRPAPDPRKPRR